MPNSVSFQDLTPLSFLDRSAAVYPNKPAVIYNDTTYTYAEFDARVNRLAGALRQAGVRKGDRVAFMVPNIPPMLEGHYGPMRSRRGSRRHQHPAVGAGDRLHPEPLRR